MRSPTSTPPRAKPGISKNPIFRRNSLMPTDNNNPNARPDLPCRLPYLTLPNVLFNPSVRSGLAQTQTRPLFPQPSSGYHGEGMQCPLIPRQENVESNHSAKEASPAQTGEARSFGEKTTLPSPGDPRVSGCSGSWQCDKKQ